MHQMPTGRQRIYEYVSRGAFASGQTNQIPEYPWTSLSNFLGQMLLLYPIFIKETAILAVIRRGFLLVKKIIRVQ